MLASKASAARSISRIARSFATVVDTAGLKVAAVDPSQPTAAVTVVVKAGSRYETKPGVAHALKNFAFKVSVGAPRALGSPHFIVFRARRRGRLSGPFGRVSCTVVSSPRRTRASTSL